LSSYKFIKGFPIKGFRENFETSLFHHPEHLLLQSKDGWSSYAIADSSESIIDAIIHFHIHEGVALSPLRAPFGSMVFSKELPVETIKDFFDFIEADFRKKGIYRILIKNYPDAYFSNQSVILKSLLPQYGFLNDTDQSAVISISEKLFDDILHKSARKRLKKCNNANLTVRKLPHTKLVDTHSFLKKCREDKGYTLSMSRSEMERTIEVFPDNFYVFAVFANDEEMIAANISILVNRRLLYNFYHDHIKSADYLSPVILLNKCMYEFCQHEGIEVLDLGTSSVEGVINQSLLDFKIRLGAVTSPKATFVKTMQHG